jgi:hypothetical protein
MHIYHPYIHVLYRYAHGASSLASRADNAFRPARRSISAARRVAPCAIDRYLADDKKMCVCVCDRLVSSVTTCREAVKRAIKSV